VSIIVVNHNYGRFLAEAINSALAQTHDGVQIIIVDDGSTDDSHAVIERYRSRVLPIFKKNGGQASAFNAGFRHATGSVVIFLDSDDLLDRDTAAQVAAAFASRPGLAKVHYRLALIDRDGTPTGGVVPPSGLPLAAGDLRELLRNHPDDVPYPPASGNAFASWALRRVLPMPEDEYRILADVYLLNLIPLLGPVEVLEGTGGRYRIHDANSHYAATLRLDRVRATVSTTHTTHVHMKRLAESLGLRGFPDPPRDDRSLVFLSHRLVSRKLEPQLHPFPGDSLPRLAVRGGTAALRRSGMSWGLRLLYPAWFLATSIAPRRAATWLSELMLYPERRGALSSMIERLRGWP
jgi:glycosyltransferase involved in cell wall biosynthesis